MPYVTYSMWFRLVTLPNPLDKYMNLFEIGNTAATTPKSQFTVFFRNDRLTCDFDNNETMDIGPVPLDGGWHQIQVIVFFGATTYTAQVSYDGGSVQTLDSADNKTAASVKTLWIHYPGTAVDYIMDVDDIQMITDGDATRLRRRRLRTAPAGTPAAPCVDRLLRVVRERDGRRPADVGQHGLRPIDRRSGRRERDRGVVFDANGVRGQCARFYNTAIASSTFGFLGKRVDQQTRIYLRRYYYLDVLPANRTSVLVYKFGGTGNGQLGGTHNGAFALGGKGQSHKFTLVNNNSNSTVSQSVVPLNSWFRVSRTRLHLGRRRADRPAVPRRERQRHHTRRDPDRLPHRRLHRLHRGRHPHQPENQDQRAGRRGCQRAGLDGPVQ